MSKRSDILDATLDLIVEEGIQAVTLSKILKKADVGSGTLYNYFSSKDDLIYALYQEIHTNMADFILKNYDPTASIKLRFDYLTLSFLDYSVRCFDELNFAEQYSYLLHKIEQADNSINNVFFHEVTELLLEGQKQMLIKDLDIQVLTHILSGIIISSAKGCRADKFVLDDFKKKEIINACWNSIRA